MDIVNDQRFGTIMQLGGIGLATIGIKFASTDTVMAMTTGFGAGAILNCTALRMSNIQKNGRAESNSWKDCVLTGFSLASLLVVGYSIIFELPKTSLLPWEVAPWATFLGAAFVGYFQNRSVAMAADVPK